MTNDTDQWLKWSWVYGSLTVERCESLDAALERRWYAQDDESFMCIEGPDGVVPSEVVEADDDRRYAADRIERESRPAPTCGVRIAGPDGETRWAWWDTFTDRAEAEYVAESLRPRFGDRVKVSTIPLSVRDM